MRFILAARVDACHGRGSTFRLNFFLDDGAP